MQALQTATIASALPFSVALLGAFWGFGKALVIDGAKRQITSIHPPAEAGNTDWRQRLANLLAYPADGRVQDFQREVVFPAMHSFAQALNEHDVRTQITNHINEDGALRLEVAQGTEIDFAYEVRVKSHPKPDQPLSGKALEEMVGGEIFYRAEVHLIEGGQDYDIMGWSQEQVVLDMLNQYETHLHFLHTVR